MPIVYFPARGPKGQHSAPRGGPPRSWTNDELTKALKNVWNRQMTTSQASRIYGIPYNSLLMYVRGKYGKSLKLDKLKETTPAAKDNLNTIGNSRSTPKEKSSKSESSPVNKVSKDQRDKHHGVKKFKHHNKDKRSGQGFRFNLFDPNVVSPFGPYGRGDQMSRFMMGSPGVAGLPMKELLKQIQAHQTAYDHSKRMQELEKQLGSEQAKLLLPLFEAQTAAEMIVQYGSDNAVPDTGAAASLVQEMCRRDIQNVSDPEMQESGCSPDTKDQKSKSDENENELPTNQKKS